MKSSKIAWIIYIICFLGCNEYPKRGTKKHLNQCKETYQSIFEQMQRGGILTITIDNGVSFRYRSSKIQNVSNETILDLLHLVDLKLVHIDTTRNTVKYKIGNEMYYILYLSPKEKVKTYNYSKNRLYRIENNWYCWQTTQFGQLAPIPNE